MLGRTSAEVASSYGGNTTQKNRRAVTPKKKWIASLDKEAHPCATHRGEKEKQRTGGEGHGTSVDI